VKQASNVAWRGYGRAWLPVLFVTPHLLTLTSAPMLAQEAASEQAEPAKPPKVCKQEVRLDVTCTGSSQRYYEVCYQASQIVSEVPKRCVKS
jgi:hypothetical protein